MPRKRATPAKKPKGKPAPKAAGKAAKQPVKPAPKPAKKQKAKPAPGPKERYAARQKKHSGRAPASKPKRSPRKPPAPTEPPAVDSLTYRQRLFVAYYAGEAKGNGTKAARLAGYAVPDVEAVRLLGNARISAAISARTAAVALSQDEVLARLSDIASADIGPFLTTNALGDPGVDLEALRAAGLTHLIRKIRPTLHGVVIELHDPVRTLELLGRYHGLFDGEAGTTDAAPATKPRLVIPKKDDRSGPGNKS